MKLFTKLSRRAVLTAVAFSLIGVLGYATIYIGQVYAVTPDHMREPEVNHYHMRMQLFIDGEYIDFGAPEFQEDYVEGQCTEGLTETPIHFHDQTNQYVHVHWSGISGGEVLKYYGIDRIDGPDNIMGYRTDRTVFPEAIPVWSEQLEDTGQPMFIYRILPDGTVTRSNNEDFLNLPMEEFFGVQSKLTKRRIDAQNAAFNGINPFGAVTASAHGDVIKSDKTDAELRELNDLLGDVVIYIQDTPPTLDQIEARIPLFVELTESTCGG